MTDSINLDPAETEKFNQHASQWWDPLGPLRTLHEINPVRLEYIRQHSHLRNQRVVDIGCGGGVLSETMADHGATVVGIDLADQAIETARLHAMEAGLVIDYQLTSSSELSAAEPAGFDLVTCMELLEHVPNPPAVIADCAALVKPGGWLFFSTVNRSPIAFTQVIVAAEYLLQLLPRGTHDYAKFIRPSELARWCRSAGLEVVDIRGLGYNPITHAASLRENSSANYLLATRKPAG
jgi:2-polyprenyl-6-hydroxyphenyl methylase/3-demethylubiquinone-9 3-methyltransferase